MLLLLLLLVELLKLLVLLALLVLLRLLQARWLQSQRLQRRQTRHQAAAQWAPRSQQGAAHQQEQRLQPLCWAAHEHRRLQHLLH